MRFRWSYNIAYSNPQFQVKFAFPEAGEFPCPKVNRTVFVNPIGVEFDETIRLQSRLLLDPVPDRILDPVKVVVHLNRTSLSEGAYQVSP